MPFVSRKTRCYTLKYDKNDISFEADFEWVCSENQNLSEVRNRLSGYDRENKNNPKNMEVAANLNTYNLRRSLIAVRNVIDPEGNPISIKDENGIINEEIQKAVFEDMLGLEGVFEELQIAYLGPTSKN